MKLDADECLGLSAPLPCAEVIKKALPLSAQQQQFVQNSRSTIIDILEGNDPRLLIIIGPCSIHDILSAKEYALRLKVLQQKYQDKLYFVMRTYFEKPRTSVGWKGLIVDPHLDGSCHISEGLHLARSFLSFVIDQEIPTASELLDVITPEYLSDLLCWGAIGARTVESQIHRQLASGLSMPLGFKNNTSGSILAAIHAMQASGAGHTFLGVDEQGKACVMTTPGNKNSHLILRGGRQGPNYHSFYLKYAYRLLKEHGLCSKVMVDCSHGNSSKDPAKQAVALASVLEQLQGKDHCISGFMLESNLSAGSQPFPRNSDKLDYGVSITDACIDWEETEILIEKAYQAHILT